MKKSPGIKRDTPQKNTLLRYFARTPTSGHDAAKQTTSTADAPAEKPPAAKQYRLLEIVWAKLEGYPWWPSIVCNDPQRDTFERSGQIHVQFFDDPVSHAWISKRDIKPYQEPVLVKQMRDPQLKKGIEAANHALNLEEEDRGSLIGPLHGDESADPRREQPIEPPKRKAIHTSDSGITPKRFKRVCIEDDSDDDDSQPDDDDDDYQPESEQARDLNLDLESDMSDFEENGPGTRMPAKVKKASRSRLDSPVKDSNTNKQSEPKPRLRMDSNHVTDNQDAFFTMFDDLDAVVRADPTAECNAPMESTVAPKRCKMTVSRQNLKQAITAEQGQHTNWPHLSYSFLKPNEIADAQRNKMLVNGELNPAYDPSTLYVPVSFLNAQTPALRQWWELKAQHFDTILFFKMGKFYEFFHMDAVICANELKILFMRGENAHAGFPEKNYKQYADALIQKGYKVARIEQTETPDMMIERCRRSHTNSKFQKVVQREICRISTLGTRLMSDVDADASMDSISYLTAFTGKPIKESKHEFGVCFLDVSIGRVYVAQFQDDRFHTQLRTLFSHHPPVEILMESSSKLKPLIKSIVPGARIQTVKRFWSPRETLKYLYEKNVWSAKTKSFQAMVLNESDPIKQTAKPEFELAVAAMGAVIQYLNQALILDDVLTMGQFQVYRPPQYDSGGVSRLPRQMVLDSMTLSNLSIFDHRKEATTLFKIIDNCVTPFGKRLLRSWTCQPLCDARIELELRQEAVRDLAENDRLNPLLKRWQAMMKAMPDLDRMLVQIHAQSLLKCPDQHPEARAILFETDIYRKRRIKAFMDTLSGFEKVLQLIDQVGSQAEWFQSRYLSQLTSLQSHGGSFPAIEEKLKYFQESFDVQKVFRDGNFVPDRGVDEEYDGAMEKLGEIEKKLDDYRRRQEKLLQVRINYVHANKQRYTLEIPDDGKVKLSRSEETFELKSSRKGFKRYHTPALLEMVAQLEEAEKHRETILADVYRRLLAKFDQDYVVWTEAISCVAQLDALMSLARTRQTFESNGSSACLPELIWDQAEAGSTTSSSSAKLMANELRNAFLVIDHSMVANDVQLENETFILTGPNMGGKTTLMRSVGLAAILAQIGAYVPASRFRLTPVDRLFARIGSSDSMFENESTFMVEVNEALAIVKYASPASLVLIDELGSGTSTSDGTAIASAVIAELTDHIRCRTMFTTHYHSILDELHAKPNIKLGFMEFFIENDHQDDDPTKENVVFLYKLRTGVCNKSYGFNVAKLAGIPSPVIRQAYRHAKWLEMQREYGAMARWFRNRNAGFEQLRTKSDNLLDLVREFIRIEPNRHQHE